MLANKIHFNWCHTFKDVVPKQPRSMRTGTEEAGGGVTETSKQVRHFFFYDRKSDRSLLMKQQPRRLKTAQEQLTTLNNLTICRNGNRQPKGNLYLEIHVLGPGDRLGTKQRHVYSDVMTWYPSGGKALHWFATRTGSTSTGTVLEENVCVFLSLISCMCV